MPRRPGRALHRRRGPHQRTRPQRSVVLAV
jgi:hypothetical protein